MATIKDVAKRAGVSVGTVSNVLNEVPTVNKPIRQRVLRSIKELNYKPNWIAKSLISGRTKTLAFIVPDICNPFFPEMVRGASDKASEYDYGLFLGNIDNNPQKETEYIQHFLSHAVDGFIIATSDCSSDQVDQIKRLDVPVVIVDRELEGLKRDLVIVDNVRSAQTAVNHLIGLGHKRIGIILGQVQTMTAKLRLEGGKLALQAAGLFNEKLIRSGTYTYESGFGMMQSLLSGGKNLDAVFCANDMIAIGAINALEKEGYKVPEDVAVVGFDDISISRLIKPPLTTIRQPTYELGAIAVNMTIERIKGTASGVPRKVMLPGELAIRESTVKNSLNRKGS